MILTSLLRHALAVLAVIVTIVAFVVMGATTINAEGSKDTDSSQEEDDSDDDDEDEDDDHDDDEDEDEDDHDEDDHDDDDDDDHDEDEHDDDDDDEISDKDFAEASSKNKDMVRREMMMKRDHFKKVHDQHKDDRKEFFDAIRDFHRGKIGVAEFDKAVDAYKDAVKGVREGYKEARDEWKKQKNAEKRAKKEANAQRKMAAKERVKAAREEFRKTRMERFKKRCALRDARQSAADGFGVPFSVNKPNRALLLDVACDTGTPDFTLEAGTGAVNEYIYKYGYVFNNERKKWEKFEFDSIDGEEVGSWIVGDAFVDIEDTVGTPDEETHVVAYVCEWTGSEWKCGCSDRECRTPKWMLQTVPAFDKVAPDFDESTAPPSDDDDTANDTSAVNDDVEEEEDDTQTGTDREFTISASNFEFDANDITVKKGDTVTIKLDVEEGTHDWVLDEFDAETDVLNAGDSDTITFVADQVGEFEFYCSVGNHRALGMVGTFTVL